MYMLWILAYFLNILVASAVHLCALTTATSGGIDIINTKILTPPLSKGKVLPSLILKYTISPDYWSASSFKKNDLNQQELGVFIKKSNLYNLLFTSILVLNYLITQPDFELFYYFVIIRTISRSFEVMIAFYNDVMDYKKKTSDLKPSDRVRLAVRSYFEIIVINTLLYCVLDDLFKFIHSRFGISSLLSKLFESIGISTFTDVSFEKVGGYISEAQIDIICKTYIEQYRLSDLQVTVTNSFVALQVFTSLCLISFALARYIGEK